jgi:hypothetical protein
VSARGARSERPEILDPTRTFACSILKQTSRHPGVPKPTTEPRRRAPRDEHDLLVAQLEVDLVARLQSSAITQRLGYDYLSLGTYATNHAR